VNNKNKLKEILSMNNVTIYVAASAIPHPNGAGFVGGTSSVVVDESGQIISQSMMSHHPELVVGSKYFAITSITVAVAAISAAICASLPGQQTTIVSSVEAMVDVITGTKVSHANVEMCAIVRAMLAARSSEVSVVWRALGSCAVAQNIAKERARKAAKQAQVASRVPHTWPQL